MRLLLASPISADAVASLHAQHDVLLGYQSTTPIADLIGDRQGLIVRSGVDISAGVLEAAKDLKLIVRAGSGIDNIDLDAARAAGIRVARIPGASPEAVAELALGLLLAATRHISRADAMVRRGQWRKHDLGGRLIADKTIGIVGAGRIGSRMGALCAAVGMRVLGCVEFPDADREAELAEHGIKLCDLETVLAESDIVSIHTPLNDATRSLIDRSAIERMKPGSILINTARGGIVDESAVHDALANGRLSAAAFDVHAREGDRIVPALAELPNVVLTPHIGGMAIETQEAIGRRVLEIIHGFIDGHFDDILSSEELVI